MGAGGNGSAGEGAGEGTSGEAGRFVDGASSGDAGNNGDDGNNGDAGNNGGEGEGSKASGSEGDKGTGRTGFSDLPPETQREIRELRRNEQKLREAAKDASTKARTEILAEVSKLLGGGETEMSPEELRERLDKVNSERSGAMVELAVHRAASKAGGDPEALLDSRAFLTRVGKLDPEAEDFTAKVADEIKSAVADNPKLGAGAPATRSGGEIGGASGDKPTGDSWAEIDKRAREARRRF
jgi:hypothetical protein